MWVGYVRPPMFHRAIKQIGVLALASFALASAFVACSNEDEPGKNVLGVTFGSADVQLVIGEATAVDVILARPRGLVGQAVSLQLAGLPEGVSGTFSSSTITGDRTTLVLAANAQALKGENSIVVTATPAVEKERDAQSSTLLKLVERAPITVTGKVHLSNGTPAVNAIVHVLAYRATASVDAITDATGSFTVADIAPPYDVNVVFEPDGMTGYINNIYLDLMSATPFLGMLHVTAASQPSSMTLTGQVTGGDNTDNVDAAIDCDSGQETRRGTVSAEVYNFATTLPAPSGTQVAGMFRAITSARLGNVVSAFKRFGQQAVTLAGGGGNHIVVDLNRPLVNRTINVQGRDGDGELVDDVALLWVAGNSTVEINHLEDLTAAENSLVVPIDRDVPVMVRLRRGERTEMYERITATTTLIDATAPTGPELLSPLGAAQNEVVDETAFATSEVIDATYVFGIFDKNGTKPVTYVTTTSPAFNSGRLRRLSAGLPAATGYQLQITAVVTQDDEDMFSPARTTKVGLARSDRAALMATEKVGFATKVP